MGASTSGVFQYPQADRRGCNPHDLGGQLLSDRVSVSTSGSKGVQPYLSIATASFAFAFQYPQADRRGCNNLQPMYQTPPRLGFSIHKRIEGGATVYLPSRCGIFSGVSVSTSGSKGVQPVRIRRREGIDLGFSIHKRIEGGATVLHQ